MVTEVWRDGQRLTPWMDYQIGRLNADCIRLFGVRVIVSSAIRTYEEQKRIFLERYVTAGNVRGRRVYDTRWWNGQLWYRISSAGTVAVPGSSNHEIQGSQAAVDLRDSGSDGGLATMGSARSNWLRANAWRYDMVPSGFGFGEAWHYDIRNIFNTPPTAPTGGGAQSIPKEDGNMQSIQANGHIYGIDVEFITHYGDVPQATITSRVNSVTDEIHKISLADFTHLLDGMGIPRDVVDGNKGKVFNPQANGGKGAMESNGTWSRRRETLARLADLDRKVTEYAAKVAAAAPATPAK
ncbi:endolysin [Microbacterium phage DelaGarza]|nr:endolysin [Microbacterium phage DelaGarza]